MRHYAVQWKTLVKNEILNSLSTGWSPEKSSKAFCFATFFRLDSSLMHISYNLRSQTYVVLHARDNWKFFSFLIENFKEENRCEFDTRDDVSSTFTRADRKVLNLHITVNSSPKLNPFSFSSSNKENMLNSLILINEYNLQIYAENDGKLHTHTILLHAFYFREKRCNHDGNELSTRVHSFRTIDIKCLKHYYRKAVNLTSIM